MDASHIESAAAVRLQIARGSHTPASFRDALLRVAPTDRDAWVNRVFGLDDVPDDGPELPRGCVPYLPSSVEALLQVIRRAPVGPSDVFVDVGSGLGRAAALVHLLTGAEAIGLEIQRRLVDRARELATRLRVSGLSWLEGDAAELVGHLHAGTVFFLYCPFGGERLAKTLAALEPIARAKTIRVCCVELPPLDCPWLAVDPPRPGEPAIHRSTLHPPRA